MGTWAHGDMSTWGYEAKYFDLLQKWPQNGHGDNRIWWYEEMRTWELEDTRTYKNQLHFTILQNFSIYLSIITIYNIIHAINTNTRDIHEQNTHSILELLKKILLYALFTTANPFCSKQLINSKLHLWPSALSFFLKLVKHFLTIRRL